jgi:hypothetical protein
LSLAIKNTSFRIVVENSVENLWKAVYDASGNDECNPAG